MTDRNLKQFKMSNRKFEKLSCIKHDIPLPKRGTVNSAGYDISIIHPAVYDLITTKSISLEEAWNIVKKAGQEIFHLPSGKSNFVFPTGVKARMNSGNVLMLFVRSSMGIKKGIKLSNQTGIIDADYYNNPDNEGHIMVALDIPEKDGLRFLEFEGPTMRVCQGIFVSYLLTEDDDTKIVRLGGIGST